VISSSQRSLPDNIQHSQQTGVHALGGIRTHSLSRRAVAGPRLKRRDHWDPLKAFRERNLLTPWTGGLVVPRVDLKALETRRYSLFCAEKNPNSRFFLSRFLFTVPTNRVGQTSKIKVNHFPFIGLNSLLVTDEKVGGTDGSQLQCRECSRKRLLEILNVVS